MPSRAIRPTTTALAAASALLLGALALAPQAGAATLYACVKKKSGTARFVSARTNCRRSERKIAWNTQGVPGRNGAKGKNGANGKNGITGKNGTNGKDGASGANGRDGASAALVAFSDSPVELPLSKHAVATLASIPAGNYVLSATAHFEDTNLTEGVTVNCTFAGDEAAVELEAKGGRGSVSLVGIAVSPLVSSEALECDTSGTSAIVVSFARIVAIQVQTLGGTTS
jgi:hypothetical protein